MLPCAPPGPMVSLRPAAGPASDAVGDRRSGVFAIGDVRHVEGLGTLPWPVRRPQCMQTPMHHDSQPGELGPVEVMDPSERYRSGDSTLWMRLSHACSVSAVWWCADRNSLTKIAMSSSRQRRRYRRIAASLTGRPDASA